jgi:DNA-directed RNA polymerase subunit M/transcription elongation factor TFIIS
MKKIPFTDNYDDLSTERGYQFKFFCERCGNGFMSSFQKSSVGMAAGVMGIVGNFLGGTARRIASTTEEAHRMTSGVAHDKAFEEAIDEIKPSFIQCPRCSKWVCKERCFNNDKGLCKECAPDVGVEMAAAQASRTVEEIHAHAQVAEKDLPSNVDWKEKRVKALCPKCGVSLTGNVKFCPECGEELYAKEKCPKCGAELSGNSKFCPECGNKLR